jgi:hypothetical protein
LAGEYPKYPLIEAAIRRSPLSRSWTIAAVAGVLLLLLVLAASLDGVLTSLFSWSELRYVLFFVVFITYIMVVYPFMVRSRGEAIQAFKPIVSLGDDAFNKVAANISKPNRRWEWIAIFLGIPIFLGALFQPWTLDWASGYFWLTVYFVLTATIVYGLSSWLIYDTLIGIVRVSRLSRQNLKLDILDTEMLTPVARWSLGISLVFVGAIILSTITNWEIMLDWRNITGFAFMICITLLVFFLSMWTAHRAMNEAKKSKLATIHRHMSAISGEVDERMVGDQFSGTEKLSSNLNVLVNYQRLVKDAPTWPFNAAIFRRLLVSILTPGLVYLVKILSQAGIRFGA